MPNITIDGTTYPLPIDDYQAQKVPNYNSALLALEAAWTAYSPTWTNLTVGNGTVVAKYRRIGTVVFVHISLVWGSTTSISGDVSVSLPVTSIDYPGSDGATRLGSCVLRDASVPAVFFAVAMNISTTAVRIQRENVSGSDVKAADISSSSPFTWTTSDEINMQFVYEAA